MRERGTFHHGDVHLRRTYWGDMPEVGIDRAAVFGVRELNPEVKHSNAADSAMVLVLAANAKHPVPEVCHEFRFRILV